MKYLCSVELYRNALPYEYGNGDYASRH